MLNIVGSLLLTAFVVLVPFARNFWPLFLILVLQGFTTSISVTASSALTVDEGRRFGMGSMMSMLFLSMSLGSALGPIVSGGIAQAVDINWVFYFGGIMSFVGTGLFWWFTRRKMPNDKAQMTNQAQSSKVKNITQS